PGGLIVIECAAEESEQDHRVGAAIYGRLFRSSPRGGTVQRARAVPCDHLFQVRKLPYPFARWRLAVIRGIRCERGAHLGTCVLPDWPEKRTSPVIHFSPRSAYRLGFPPHPDITDPQFIDPALQAGAQVAFPGSILQDLGLPGVPEHQLQADLVEGRLLEFVELQGR